MRHAPIPKKLFRENRQRLAALLPPKALAVVNANDVLPTNADGTFPLSVNSDLFYLTGVEQEESVLLLFPEATDPRFREILFLREANPDLEIWEGHKLSQDEARALSGIARVEWTSALPGILHLLMGEAERVCLNSNEHARAACPVETREMRFVADLQRKYPLHEYVRLARLLHRLRAVKSSAEVALLRQAAAITHDGFARVARYLRPGVGEMELEAEFAHEFIRQGGNFAYTPIIASGAHACVLHYIQNDGRCRAGELLLLDVASSYANYNADLTRTLPVSGRFSRRQRQVYQAVLRVFRQCAALLKPGITPMEWRQAAESFTEKELVDLKLLTMAEVRKQGREKAALRRYFMHGIGHPIGLDVHDVAPPHAPMQVGWVMTCEPGIYIREEKLGLRLENIFLLTETGAEDLMADIPLEADDIEALMAGGAAKPRPKRSAA